MPNDDFDELIDYLEENPPPELEEGGEENCSSDDCDCDADAEEAAPTLDELCSSARNACCDWLRAKGIPWGCVESSIVSADSWQIKISISVFNEDGCKTANAAIMTQNIRERRYDIFKRMGQMMAREMFLSL